MLCRYVYLCPVFAAAGPVRQVKQAISRMDFPIHTPLCSESDMIFAAAPQSARKAASHWE
jgi:hypothetical protein